jgi:hypothetical protein
LSKRQHQLTEQLSSSFGSANLPRNVTICGALKDTHKIETESSRCGLRSKVLARILIPTWLLSSSSASRMVVQTLLIGTIRKITLTARSAYGSHVCTAGRGPQHMTSSSERSQCLSQKTSKGHGAEQVPPHFNDGFTVVAVLDCVMTWECFPD